MHEIDISSRGGPAWSCTWKWRNNINYQQVVYNGAWQMIMEWSTNFTVICIVLNIMRINWQRIQKTYKVSNRTTSHVFHYYPQFSLVKIRTVIISNIWAPALWQNRYFLRQEIKPFRNLTYQPGKFFFFTHWTPGKLIYDSLAYNIEHKWNHNLLDVFNVILTAMESVEKKLTTWLNSWRKKFRKKNRM